MKIEKLLKRHLAEKKETVREPEILKFIGVDDKDVYNITAPFKIKEKLYIAGRVEERKSEFSKVVFFEPTAVGFSPVGDALTFDLQDPFITFVDGDLIFGGVEVSSKMDSPKELEWKTVLYRGTDIYSLNKFFEGPKGMKDLRLRQLKDGTILVLTRPQGKKGGRGKIGAFIIKNLNQLTVEAVEEAPLLENQFIDEEWGGANEIHVLDESKVGVLGHIANFDDQGNRHYYSMTFILELNDLTIREAKIIADRSDFRDSPSKRPDLFDVVFSGGLVVENENAELYCGISDASSQKIIIENPFKGE